MNFKGPSNSDNPAETSRAAEQVAQARGKRRRRGRIIVLGVAVVLAGALTAGAWTHLTQYRLSADAAEQERDFVPQVRVANVEPSSEVDIGDRVKQGQLLAEIVAAELDHQIAQAEATLSQLKWALQQAEANRELASVTWDRDKRLVEQGWGNAKAGTLNE